MSKIRGFERVQSWAKKLNIPNEEIMMPKRSTKFSAGYDFVLAEDLTLEPGVPKVYWTDVKAYMLPDEFLEVFIRSSMAIKKRVVLANQTGIIDCDYYQNESNDGNIGICLLNLNFDELTFYAGDKIAQGVFTKYLIIDREDFIDSNRTGGVGSTN